MKKGRRGVFRVVSCKEKDEIVDLETIWHHVSTAVAFIL